MPNPVRNWKNFLTAWEKLDEEAHQKVIYEARRTLVKLRAHLKDINSRITYWENNLDLAQQARRNTEQKARNREWQDRHKNKN